jgi:hypothetical protein
MAGTALSEARVQIKKPPGEPGGFLLLTPILLD